MAGEMAQPRATFEKLERLTETNPPADQCSPKLRTIVTWAPRSPRLEFTTPSERVNRLLEVENLTPVVIYQRSVIRSAPTLL